MKQNFLSAKSNLRDRSVLVAAFVSILLLNSACATRPSTAKSTLNLEAATVSSSRININVATSAELEKLPGVGKVIAERIVAHRSEHGPFRRVEHLMMVRGISDQKFRDLRDLITIE